LICQFELTNFDPEKEATAMFPDNHLVTSETDQEDSDAVRRPLSADALLEDLRRCKRDCAAQEGQQQDRWQKYTDGQYQLAERIVSSASLLRESPDGWARFIASPDWAGQKPPKRGQRADAIKHAVRFVLTEDASRQVRNYWKNALQELSDEGIDPQQIAATLSERHGFEAICKAKRQRNKTKLPTDCSGRVKLFRKPTTTIPPILRDAIIVTQEDGQIWLEDGAQRRLLILAVQPGLLGCIEPGELEFKAIVGEDDLSVLELTAVVVKHPAKDLHLRQNLAVPERKPQQSPGSDIGQPLEP
jgi:hypothetical protein